MTTLLQSHLTDAEVAQMATGTGSIGHAAGNHLAGCEYCRDRVAYAQRAASSPDVPADLRALTQYTDIKRLDAGGMGVVYLAFSRLMDRQEVLKVIGAEHLSRPDIAKRFLREMQAAAKLNHKHIVTAYTAIQAGPTLAFAMEYVPGESLSKILKIRGALKIPTACHDAYQAALGLQHAHERGMVHRDIKPANLMIVKEGKRRTLKILDFGLAKAVSERTAHSGLTTAGQALGTPAYMAPEQASDAATADIRADVYALGCTLYELLTGQRPFTLSRSFDLMLAHKQNPRPNPRSLRPEVSEELAGIVMKMMAIDPADRYQTPAEVARALSPFAVSPRSGTDVTPVPPPRLDPTSVQTAAWSDSTVPTVPQSALPRPSVGTVLSALGGGLLDGFDHAVGGWKPSWPTRIAWLVGGEFLGGAVALTEPSVMHYAALLAFVLALIGLSVRAPIRAKSNWACVAGAMLLGLVLVCTSKGPTHYAAVIAGTVAMGVLAVLYPVQGLLFRGSRS